MGDESPSSSIAHESLSKETLWDNLFLLLMSSRSAMSLTVRLQPNNSLWSFKEKISQTFLLGKYIWADFSGKNPKEEGHEGWLAITPRSI